MGGLPIWGPGMEKMFERLFSIFRRKRARAPVNSGFLKPKDEPVKKPVLLLSDPMAPLPVQETPAAIILPPVEKPAVENPVEIIKPVVQLPPDLDPSKVIVVRHDVKKADGERFKYSDKPLKPLRDETRGPEVIKYNDKREDEVIKYRSAPAAPRAEAEGRKGEVFKYTPSRVVIKN